MSDYFHTMEHEYYKLIGQITQKLNKIAAQPGGISQILLAASDNDDNI